VLVGGPVSNVAVAELVTSGDSTVDWASSAGEIEVVQVGSNYRVIVAGGDRAATQAAADSLAGMLA
jgi:S-layer protein (TIGR01564 family)